MADSVETATQPSPTDSKAADLARYYDLDLEDESDDIDMYIAFADRNVGEGPVLELMAGTGRVAIPLAADGHVVFAVDRDQAALARAESKWAATKPRADEGSLHLVEADVVGLELPGAFSTVIVALNSVLLLNGRAAQAELFATIARHLSPNGRALIDTWLPAPDDLALYDGRIALDWVKADPDSGRFVAKQTSARYESGTRTAHITSFFDEWRDGEPAARILREDTITFLSVDELQRFARDAGLDVETIAADYEMGHFAAPSDRVVMVCRRHRS